MARKDRTLQLCYAIQQPLPTCSRTESCHPKLEDRKYKIHWGCTKFNFEGQFAYMLTISIIPFSLLLSLLLMLLLENFKLPIWLLLDF